MLFRTRYYIRIHILYLVRTDVPNCWKCLLFMGHKHENYYRNSDSWFWWWILAVQETNWVGNGNIMCCKCKVRACRSQRIITTTTAAFCYVVRQKKIGVFTVCWPTLFYSCRPYHFFSKNKKTRLLSDPAQAVPDFSTGIQIFRWFYSIPYVVKPFTDTFGFCQSKMATFSSLFVSKYVITKIRKACLKQQVITRWLEIFNDNYPCNGLFLLWVYFPLL